MECGQLAVATPKKREKKKVMNTPRVLHQRYQGRLLGYLSLLVSSNPFFPGLWARDIRWWVSQFRACGHRKKSSDVARGRVGFAGADIDGKTEGYKR
jgi:hypothetical protein